VVQKIFSQQEYCEMLFSEIIAEETEDVAKVGNLKIEKVDGDTLIAAPQKCDHISDFIKYSSFGTFLNGKLSVISVVSVVLSILTGLAAANYYESTFYGLYAAAAIQCFTSLPILFFIKDFPLYSAAKKLNKKGAMIAGQMGANHIEMANALVLNSADIFPSGTVTLHQMKVLSENNLDQTVLSAASLTAALNSPLAPIFKKIAGESNIETLPDSDTIKYEERMGISGWVNNKLLFIGNRTLMEAHGIQVPDIEIDRKILRNGYFPVYVASADKVCALLVVQYSVNPDVAYELRRLTKIGVTLLVNNTDPNVSSEMICDYLGLYDDAVMIMTNAGYHMYKNSITEKEACSAPASFRRGNITIASIMNCANKIRRSNTLLTVLYVISAILGIIIFAYSSFAGSGTLIGSTTVLLYSLICTVFSYLLYLILKP
jgi:Cu+-exporting ATPase